MTREAIEAWLAARLAEIQGIDPRTVDLRERFGRYGLDSRRAAELLARLSTVLGRTLSPTLVWDHPTIETLARHLSGAADPTPQRAHGGALRPAESEPIAIIGMACRFPKAPDLEAFWELLRDGVDAITEVPRDRWDVDALYDGDPAVPGKMTTRWGGFLEQVDQFDPLFFGISPREAEQMDPQQRLMLELSWEALEDSGTAPERSKGSRTGVFFGAMWDDYAKRSAGVLEAITQHTATGQDLSIIPARVSYTLGLQGPSVAVNTACSSSLVAVHLACQSLREGDAEVALAGGVNLIIAPESTVAVSKFGGLSPDGRCFTFDARANGYVRGEGGGVVVLKPLSRALADGDRIYAVLRGSAVNNDGASNGLTAPNPRAQEEVLRLAYERAGVDPSTVDYVEAHGTGTQLGDPIEARALGAVLGAGRPAERPLLVGSAKTNIGHAEPAAGMGGLIKVALCLGYRAIPPSLHFETPNPHIPFAELRLAVPRSLTPWPVSDRPATAGISGFGFGGTNAHVVLQSLSSPHAELPVLRSEAVSSRPPKVVFVFSGLGSQWLGMGRSLAHSEPVFRAALVACDHLVEEHLGWSLFAELAACEQRSRRDEVDVSFPLVVSIEIALAALWRSWGVEPAAVVGHSIGEVAAAHVAGALSLEDAMRVVCTQGRLMRRIRGRGALGVVALSWDQAGEALRGYEGQLERAVHAGPEEVVLSGEPEALDEVLEALGSRGIFGRRVNADVAAHSPQVDPLRHEMLEALRTITPRPASVPIVSGVMGAALAGERFDAQHWVRNLAEPLRFREAIESISAEGADVFLEVGPHPIVGRTIESILGHAGRKATVLPSLRRDEDERSVLLGTLKALASLGQPVPPRMAPAAVPAGKESALVLPLSAKSAGALSALADSYVSFLRRDGSAHLEDIAYTASVGRSHHAHRLAVVGRSADEIGASLEAFVKGEGPSSVASGSTTPGARRTVVFVFPGQGSQWAGMGRGLLAQEPVFRAAVEACDTLVKRYAPFSLLEELAAPEATSRLDHTEIAQPALFAVQVALAALWRSWGVVPEAVIGHSVGEVAAAHVAGALSLEQAVRLVVLRGRIMEQATGRGRMASAALSAGEAALALKGYEDRLAVAAINDPRSVVLSGEARALDEVLARLDRQKVSCRMLRVDYAFHSPQMTPFQRALEKELGSLDPCRTALTMYSTVTGAKADGAELGAGYWAKNLREPVQLAGAVEAAYGDGHRIFLEVGPHPVLAANLEQCFSGKAEQAHAIPTLRRGQDERRSLLQSLGTLYAHGYQVDWKRLYPAGGRRVALPTYPWQRQRYWLEAPRPRASEPQPAALQALLDATDGAALAEQLGMSAVLSAEELSGVTRVLEALRARTQQISTETEIREWLYTLAWRPRPLLSSPLDATGHWVVLVDDGGVGERVAEALEAAGAVCSRLRREASSEPCTAADIEAWWSERTAARGPVRGVVHLWSLGDAPQGEDGLDAALARSVYSALAWVQAVTKVEQSPPAKLWFVTRGAMSVGAGDPVTAPEQAPLWGLGRVVSLEHPEVWGGLIDLPSSTGDDMAPAVVAHMLAGDGEDHAALRVSGRFVQRLERHRPAVQPPGRAWSTTGTALITGGLGALGMHVARWLARQGVKHLVLMSRRGPSAPEAKAALASLEALGAQVTVAQADVADAREVAAVLADIEARLPALSAVFHTAGVLDDGILMQQTPARFAAVLAPKVQGTLVLDALTRDRPLEAFVCFSSVASAWGSGSQASYAAANAFLDGWVKASRAKGRAAVGVNWGPWRDGGMVTEALLTALERRGVRAMRPDAAIQALSVVLAGEAEQVVVADIDWPRFRSTYETRGARFLLANMPSASQAAPAAVSSPLLEELEALPARERRPRLQQWLQKTVAQTLGFGDAEQVSLTTTFFDVGMDSLMAVELRVRLQASLGRSLPTSVIFNFPSVEALAGYLEAELFAEPAPSEGVAPPQAVAWTQEPIAVVGIGCRFPGGASSPEAFWQLLQQGASAIREVPPERWDVDAFYDAELNGPDKMSTRWGGFLDDLAAFDFSFFGLSRREASAMDPMQRLVLEVAWEALENAGVAPPRLATTLTGVFFGVGNPDYHTLLLTPPDRGSTGVATSIIANRLSYLLDLRGPSVALDTACSSSLVAVHLACQSLRARESNLVIAGGVNVLLDPLLTVATSQAGMMARDGRCKTFDAAADGYVRSEGCGAVVLKRLSDAQRDGDRILALIRGSAVNQDGRSIGLTAPNGLAQEAVIRKALENAGLAPAQIDYVEAHGTGTPLGDGIEVQALAHVLGAERAPGRVCGLGSVKTNIGHLEAAAGIAGLIKTVLTLQHGAIPPHRLATTINPALELDRTPFVIPTVEHPVTLRPHFAGVSSFGFGGTNAHVVLEAPPEDTSPDAPHAPSVMEAPARALLTLSAKHPKALQELAGRYEAYLAEHPDAVLAEVCATANAGRGHFPHRLAILADTASSLRDKLATVSAGLAPADAYQGKAPDARPKVAFLFSGQGSQYVNMGRRLYETEPVFREALEQCHELLRPVLSVPLLDVLYPRGEAGSEHLDDTTYAQPALFAIEYALTRLWAAWGVEPDAVLGHSVGEYVAAVVAGVMRLEDGLRLIAERARLMGELPRDGGMAMVLAAEAVVAPLLTPYSEALSLAAVNGPKQVVLSGRRDALQAVLDSLEHDFVGTRPMKVSHAFHSPLMEPMLSAFEQAASRVEYAPPAAALRVERDGADDVGDALAGRALLGSARPRPGALPRGSAGAERGRVRGVRGDRAGRYAGRPGQALPAQGDGAVAAVAAARRRGGGVR